MRMYQLVMRGGLTRNVEAESYSRRKKAVVFVLDDGSTLKLRPDELIMIEEVRDHLNPGSMADRRGHRQIAEPSR